MSTCIFRQQYPGIEHSAGTQDLVVVLPDRMLTISTGERELAMHLLQGDAAKNQLPIHRAAVDNYQPAELAELVILIRKTKESLDQVLMDAERIMNNGAGVPEDSQQPKITTS